MKIIESVDEIRSYSKQLRKYNIIASIDTDSYLHEGHMSLVKIAKDNANIVIVTLGHSLKESKFSSEQYKKFLEEYKNETFSLDIDLCRLYNVDVVFHAPKGSWNHEQNLDISIPNIDRLDNILGMSTLAEMLQGIDIISPDVVIGGQKDFYQTYVLRHLVEKSNPSIKVITAPIFRDYDGLAFSSRNKFLTGGERTRAAYISKELQKISHWPSYPSVKKIKDYLNSAVKNARGFCVGIDVCSTNTLQELNMIDEEAIINVNTLFNDIIINDNIILEPK